MMGRRNIQSSFDDISWRSRIPAGSFWCKLHDWAQENLHEDDFAHLFSDKGRPSVSPLQTLLALLIQLEMGYSDREMEEESRFDDRVKFALLAGREFPGIDAVTLCDHRELFLTHGLADDLFEQTLASAKEKGLFSADNQAAIDSFMIHGAAAVQDTYTLIRRGIVRTLRIAGLHGLEAPLRSVLSRDDHEQPGKPKIDWTDPQAKRRLLESLVGDGLALVEAARKLNPLPKDLAKMVELLERVVRQDVDIDEDGRVEMVQGTAPDRIVSVEDPEMRHGRKTSSKKVNGYKAQLITSGDDGQVVVGVEVTAANVADGEALAGMVEAQAAKGRRPKRLVGDTQYYDPALAAAQAEQGTQILAKAPPLPNRAGRFTKADFAIDTQGGTVTCPANVTVPFSRERLGARKRVTVHFAAGTCRGCSLQAQCTSSGQGRSLSVHPYEAELQADRAYQKTPEFQEIYGKRSYAERVIYQLTRHGARYARYLGRAKTRFQLLLVVATHNIKQVMKPAKTGEVCPA